MIHTDGCQTISSGPRYISEAEFERIADGIIVRRLYSDPRFRCAESSEAQAYAEEQVEAEVLAELLDRYVVR